jgi:hypothetical protein
LFQPAHSEGMVGDFDVTKAMRQRPFRIEGIHDDVDRRARSINRLPNSDHHGNPVKPPPESFGRADWPFGGCHHRGRAKPFGLILEGIDCATGMDSADDVAARRFLPSHVELQWTSRRDRTQRLLQWPHSGRGVMAIRSVPDRLKLAFPDHLGDSRPGNKSCLM